jgi:hypothetical protein
MIVPTAVSPGSRDLSIADVERRGGFSTAGPIATELERLRRSARFTAIRGTTRQAGAQNRNWIQRHPALFGALVGFCAGFVIGFAPGDDAVFDDFTGEFNGLVLGGLGAATGALIGWSFGS